MREKETCILQENPNKFSNLCCEIPRFEKFAVTVEMIFRYTTERWSLNRISLFEDLYSLHKHRGKLFPQRLNHDYPFFCAQFPTVVELTVGELFISISGTFFSRESDKYLTIDDI